MGIFNSKLRYGIQLCGKVRNLDSDPTQGFMEELQKAQNKLFHLLNNTRVNDRIKTRHIAQSLKMLSVNQMNAQVKLTEMRKAMNIKDYPIKGEIQLTNKNTRSSRSITRGDLIISGYSETSKHAFINDAAKNWNNALQKIKQCKSLYCSKREIIKYVTTLPF